MIEINQVVVKELNANCAVVLAALEQNKTPLEIAYEYGLAYPTVYNCKRKLRQAGYLNDK